MAGAIELIGRGQAGRSRSDDRDPLAGAHLRRPRRDPAFVERALDDRDLDRLDGDRIVVDPEDARSFARRRTQAAGELREVVRRVQTINRRLPAIAVDEIVPVGNQISKRAPLVTKRDAAVHAAGRLPLEYRLRIGEIDFVPVVDALRYGPHRVFLAVNLEESGDLAHLSNYRPAPTSSANSGVRPSASASLCALLRGEVLEALALAGVLALAVILRGLAVRLPIARIHSVTGNELG